LLEGVIAKDALLKKKYEQVRAKYLEDETEAAFRKALSVITYFSYCAHHHESPGLPGSAVMISGTP
jgi:hypothetical protein